MSTFPHWRALGLLLTTLPLAYAQLQTTPQSASETCAACHPDILETYRKTGMGRSFYRPAPTNTIEDYTKNNTYYHKPSDSYFTMSQRDGKYFQRRYQLDSAGKQINVMEKQIDYIMGSGNHVRAYLHRTPQNKLIELPLAWYTEKGGYWAMNPGFDRPDHDGFRRPVTYPCMFCHNGYPQIPAGHDQPFAEPVYSGALPEGIDCQRCHGSGNRHIQLAKTSGAAPAAIRNAIVNPSRLPADRQLEVCMQCHLETTSFPLPNALERSGRGPFSYQPGEPIADFLLSFDHAPGTSRDDKFEIANSAYRLRKSACFLKSAGKLTCITCHDPHDIPRGDAAITHYDAACRQCHTTAFDQLTASGKHPKTTGCADCHMPKRRTEDVVHVAMTDHLIQRRKPAGDLLAERVEIHETDATAYRGKVVPYYPAPLPHTADNDLDLAVAQVIERSNLTEGIAQLTAAIERYRPQHAEYYLQLADAWRNNGQLDKTLPLYREAVRRNPKFAHAWQKLGSALRRLQQYPESETALKRAAALVPENAIFLHELGLTYRVQNKNAEAISTLQKALQLDPDFWEAHNNLGIIWLANGDLSRAEQDFREAIRIQPVYADAHSNLASLLSGKGAMNDALDHFEISLRLRPDDAPTRYNYAILLGRTRKFDAAQEQLEASLRTDPNLADAHQLLGDLLMAKDQAQLALPHYREMLRLQPQSGLANLRLGQALATLGDRTAAIPYLQTAATHADPAVREEAAQTLRQLKP